MLENWASLTARGLNPKLTIVDRVAACDQALLLAGLALQDERVSARGKTGDESERAQGLKLTRRRRNTRNKALILRAWSRANHAEITLHDYEYSTSSSTLNPLPYKYRNREKDVSVFNLNCTLLIIKRDPLCLFPFRIS